MPDYTRMSQGDLDKAVLSLALAWNDVRATGVAVEALLAHPSYSSDLLDSERSSLGEAIINAYCRPFDKDRRAVCLDAGDWPGYDHRACRDQHERLIEFRHAFVSHSERASRRGIVASTGDPDEWRFRLDLPPLFMMPGEAERTREMCDDLIVRLHDHLGRRAAP